MTQWLACVAAAALFKNDQLWPKRDIFTSRSGRRNDAKIGNLQVVLNAKSRKIAHHLYKQPYN